MKQLSKLGVLGAAVAVCSVTLLAVANANQQVNLLASPFVAADKPHSPQFEASVVSTGNRNPFFVATNQGKPAAGTYPGILLSAEDPHLTLRGLDSLSFAYKGPAAADAIIEYKALGSATHRAFARVQSRNGAVGESGFTKVSLTREQLGIPANSSVNKIVIAPSVRGQSGRFMVDELQVNGSPVKKAMNTLFFAVENNSPSGPLAALPGSGCAPSTTSVTVVNNYSDPVVVFCTLGVVSGCVTDVKTIFPTMEYNSPADHTIGFTTLNPNQSLTCNLASCYSGSFSFGSVRINCSTDKFPAGQNLAEFIVNNSFQGSFAQETIDISCVAGVNCKLRWSMDGGQNEWQTTTDTRTTPATTTVVKSITNNPSLYGNLNINGVFPFGCTNCGNNLGVPCCAPPAIPGGNPISSNPPGCEQQGSGVSFPPPPSTNWNPNPPVYQGCNPTYAPICNVQRPASCNGGSITCSYMGPTAGLSKGVKFK